MQCLNGTWKVACDPDNVGRQEQWYETVRAEAQDAPVPGIIQQVFPEFHGVAWYWTTFQPCQDAGADERCFLTFGAVDYLADVWLNGKYLGGHEIGETPFSLDVTDAVRPGKENLLAIRVLNPGTEPIDGFCLDQIPHRNKVCAKAYQPGQCFNYGGMVGNVEFHILPALRVTDVFARANLHTGEIRVTITVQNDSGQSLAGQLTASTGPAAGNGEIDATKCRQAQFASGCSEHEMQLSVAEPHLWNLDDPFLYRVSVQLQVEGGVSHEKMVRCGFRELRVDGGFFRLNGKRLFLKSTHTGNHFPVGWAVPPCPDLVRRDFLMAKVAGYNCVRFISGMALPEQLDFCDEIGLMIYEECSAGWCLQDSPHMAERFDKNLREMILRDRNHPCLTIWGLLNETPQGGVFRHAAASLPFVRSLDDTRLVILNTGRFDRLGPPKDGQATFGSLSNPGSDRWEYQWGAEDTGAVDPKASLNPVNWDNAWHLNPVGDVHYYPLIPHTPECVQTIRNLGNGTRPVFLSEYGIGSMMNVLRELRWFEQKGVRMDLSDSGLIQSMARRLEADWKRWGFDGAFTFTEDFLWDSQRRHTRQRLLGFDMIRSNPNLCGYNLTGMLDHAVTGEGAWTFWREWKPGIAEGLMNGWAPLRWCLFVDPIHSYAGNKITVEAVLANEDVLAPGKYPVCLRVSGANGIVWEKRTTVTVPAVAPGQDGPMAIPVFRGRVALDVPSGKYEFGAYMEKGGAPFGGRLTFFVSNSSDWPKLKLAVEVLALEEKTQKWLSTHGVKCLPFGKADAKKRGVILIGASRELNENGELWVKLAERMARGACVVFLSPAAFRKPTFVSTVGHLERETFWGISWRDFEVANVPKNEWAVYSKEFYGPIRYVMSDLPGGQYTIEMGFCEGYCSKEGERVFDVQINDQNVLKNFDITKEAGGTHRAVMRTFKAKPRNGRITIDLTQGSANCPSLSRLRIFDEKGEMIVEDAALKSRRNDSDWLPLKKKGKVAFYKDDLYHKDSVAKRHPIFDGLMNHGIMDWEYYGPINTPTVFEDVETSDDIAAASFGAGYIVKGGYVSGLIVASYPFGAGRFIINSLRVLENLGSHTAADRLLLNMINYASEFVKGPVAALPRDFEKTLKTIRYVE
jgi:hypothetical protein